MNRLPAPALLCFALLIASILPAEAQRTNPRASASGGDARAVRAELASVLLQSRRYVEAAREYRLLIAREPNNLNHRLGLARALAWGNQPRAAEQELRYLIARRPSDREIEALLRSVRESYEPYAREAAAWVAERPGYAPYRRALARALVREGKPVEALPHYDRLVAFDSTPALRREAANAHSMAGDYDRAALLLRRSLSRVPRDTATRHALATALVDAGDYDAALKEYDALIAAQPTSGRLLARAQLNLARRDLDAAEADATASIRARASAAAYLLLADLLRARGDFAEARTAYEYAQRVEPYHPDIAPAAARLARDERPIIAFVPSSYQAPWQLRSSAIADNEGLTYATVGARHDLELAPDLIGNVDIELRRIAQQNDSIDLAAPALALGIGLAREFSDGPLIVRVAGRGGIATHDGGATFAGGVSATGWFNAWGLSLELATAPAYPTLLTAASLRPPDGDALTEYTSRIALGGPVGIADLAIGGEFNDISDGNRRSSVQAVLRFAITPQVAVISSASGTWFAESSPLYWAPSTYIAGAAGLEFSNRARRGVSLAARLLAGPARSIEEVLIDDVSEEVERTALQLSGGGELSYRAEIGELGAALTYGSGRAGEYRRLEVGLFARLLR